MKIIWLTNRVLPIVSEAKGDVASFVNEGWLNQTFAQLCAEPEISMTIVCCGAPEYKYGASEKFKWYTVRENRNQETYYSLELENRFTQIIEQEKPDIVHIWGSEFPHSLEMVKAAEYTGLLNQTVISIQGLVSMCALYYSAGLPREVIKGKTAYELLRSAGVENIAKAFYTRGIYEIEALSLAKHCIGRTEWDYCCTRMINHNINYHKCNETLRECFYSDAWEYEQCVQHSIFVSQATYPVKGFHLLLQALPLILKQYPDTMVYVAGANLASRKTIAEKIKQSTYGQYLQTLIIQQNLQHHVCFLGKLNAEAMKQEYLKANVFVSCSSIENSPNSVGEAMLLGTPVVASDVGGTHTILNAPEEGILYRWDSIAELADAVLKVFSNPEKAIMRAKRAKEHAKKTHDAAENLKTLQGIYSEIFQSIQNGEEDNDGK